MAGSIIDALVVTLNLDSNGFNDGIMNATKSLTGFATKMAGLAIGFDALDSGIKYFTDLHRRMSDLEFTARNLGVLGTELSKLGEMAQLFGGKMSDAQDSVEGLQAAIFNLKFKGQMSESLMMLQRFGVHYLDSQGKERDEVDVARDASGAIDWQAERTPGGLSPGMRRQMALSMGLSGGLASAAAAGAANFEQVWKEVQKDQQGLTEEMLRNNAKLSQDVTRRHATRDVGNMGVLNAMIPGLEKLNEGLQDLSSKAIPYLTKGLTALTDAILHPPEVIKNIGRALEHSARIAAKSAKEFHDSMMLPAVRPGEKPISALVPFQGQWRLGELVTDSLNQGLNKFFEALKAGTAAAPGVSVIPGVVPIAPVTPLAPRPAPPTPPTSSSGAGSSKPTAMNAAPSTNIVFETVNVTSRGVDGKTLARDFTDTVKRKFTIAGADRGMA